MTSLDGRHIVDPAVQKRFEANPGVPVLGDSMSDGEAPARSFVTYRSGQMDYVSEDVLKGKVVALLFGANGPFCCGFVRAFAKVYKAVKTQDSDPFEVVYVGADTSRREFNRFVKTMPWLALPFRDNRAVFARYGVPMDVWSWPRLVVVSTNDTVMFEDATAVVRKCAEEKKPAAFGSMLAAAWTETITLGRFRTL
eukprot:TRINITY_DN75915_c0_g1_i2.p1 TRINITY_DN75915_c0_g1~~TRINITY_DN75915_c0_g1_i2.p1  ORF type:complete len:224 (-),score=33.41 TRINITY_DN75915_c0_g1_i2:293-880(-)